MKVLGGADLSDAERIRQSVMGYMNSILLKGDRKPQVVAAMQAFSNTDTYRNNRYSIIIACLDYMDLLGK